MKRIDLIRHPYGKARRSILREGGNHSVYVNRKSGKVSAVPRHREINEFLAQKICRDLEIPKRSEEHTSEFQSQSNLVCRLLLEKKKKNIKNIAYIITTNHNK